MIYIGGLKINYKKKLTVIFIVFLFIFSSINQIIILNVLAEEINESEESDEPRIGFIGKFLKKFGQFIVFLKPIIRFVVISIAADPPFIEIGYNETVNVEIGLRNFEDGGFEVFSRDLEQTVFMKRYLNFKVLEYPGGNDEGTWLVSFEPYTVNIHKGAILKTNMSIKLTSPPTASNPIQSGILKVRMLDTIGYRNLWFPPKGHPSDKPPNRFMWFFSAAFVMRFGKYSGDVFVEGKNFTILVKVKPYHSLKFEALDYIILKPDQVASIPITLQNLGNYNDTFSFRLISENNEVDFAIPYSITLAPGETKETYLGVSVPQSMFDYGTLHGITIEAYSIDDPNVTIERQTVYFETKGVYISEMTGAGLLFLTIIVILGVAFYFHRRRLFLEQYCVKPDKPWNIPAEKKYLENLKDKDKYIEVWNMMQDEYNSALLWYKYYSVSVTKPKPRKKVKVKKEKIKVKELEKEDAKLEESKREEKIKSKLEVEEKPIEKKLEKEIEPEETRFEEKREFFVDKKVEIEKRRRKQTLSRIKREQDKQKRKIKRIKTENEGE